MREAVPLEKEFIADCLPVNGVGLSREEFAQYIDYIADRRLEGVGLAPLSPGVNEPAAVAGRADGHPQGAELLRGPRHRVPEGVRAGGRRRRRALRPVSSSTRSSTTSSSSAPPRCPPTTRPADRRRRGDRRRPGAAGRRASATRTAARSRSTPRWPARWSPTPSARSPSRSGEKARRHRRRARDRARRRRQVVERLAACRRRRSPRPTCTRSSRRRSSTSGHCESPRPGRCDRGPRPAAPRHGALAPDPPQTRSSPWSTAKIEVAVRKAFLSLGADPGAGGGVAARVAERAHVARARAFVQIENSRTSCRRSS